MVMVTAADPWLETNKRSVCFWLGPYTNAWEAFTGEGNVRFPIYFHANALYLRIVEDQSILVEKGSGIWDFSVD